MVTKLQGIVSNATLLSQLDFIPDVNAELEAVQEQKAANMSLYNFNTTSTTDEDEQE